MVAWARAEGVETDEVRRLEAAGPKAVKDWAKAQGVDPKQFLTDDAPAGRPPADQMNASAGPAQAVIAAVRAAAGAPGEGRLPVRAAGGGMSPAPAGDWPAWASEQWATPDLVNQIQAVEARQGNERDEKSMLSGRPTRQKSAHGGTNETQRVELDNGMAGYHKPFAGLNDALAAGFGQEESQQPIHEAAAWQLAKRMGPPWNELVPPCVIREVNGRLGSFALERPGKPMHTDYKTVPEWKSAAFFDALIGQQDRHPGNYLVAGDRIALIDHGYAFARPGDYCNYSWIQRGRSGTKLQGEERRVLRDLLASDDMFGLEKMLEPGRAEAIRNRARMMLEFDSVPSAGFY